jgi:hypothetical protein
MHHTLHQSRACRAHHASSYATVCSVTCTVIGFDRRKVCLVLSVLGFALSYVADTCISIIIYEFCWLPLETYVLTVTDNTYHLVRF